MVECDGDNLVIFHDNVTFEEVMNAPADDARPTRRGHAHASAEQRDIPGQLGRCTSMAAINSSTALLKLPHGQTLKL
jgi:hypothetical protein